MTSRNVMLFSYPHVINRPAPGLFVAIHPAPYRRSQLSGWNLARSAGSCLLISGLTTWRTAWATPPDTTRHDTSWRPITANWDGHHAATPSPPRPYEVLTRPIFRTETVTAATQARSSSNNWRRDGCRACKIPRRCASGDPRRTLPVPQQSVTPRGQDHVELSPARRLQPDVIRISILRDSEYAISVLRD